MSKRDYLYLFLFALILFLFAILSKKIQFHDAGEYIMVAKNLAGINNIGVFLAHPIVYPLIISLFLKVSMSLSMIKLVNALWLFLIGITLLIWLKNKKAFIIFAFSPIVWYISVQTTPILPASFFFLLAFIFLKKSDIKYNSLFSGLSLGFSCALYTPMLLVIFFFILVYYWNKIFYDVIKYVIFSFLGFTPTMILDYSLFNNPFYSLIRYAGANFIVSLGLNSGTKTLMLFSQLQTSSLQTLLQVLLIFIGISPFLFKLYKLNWSAYKKEIIFLVIIGLIFLIRVPSLKYFMIVAPLAIILLSHVLNEREIKWHCIISLLLIFLMTHSYFIAGEDVLIEKDFKKITQEYNVDYVVAGSNLEYSLSTFSWQDTPKIVWFQDFKASIENKTRMRGYDFTTKSKIPLKDRLRISASFDRFTNKTYENYIFVSAKNEPLNFKIEKCYEILCVHNSSEFYRSMNGAAP